MQGRRTKHEKKNWRYAYRRIGPRSDVESCQTSLVGAEEETRGGNEMFSIPRKHIHGSILVLAVMLGLVLVSGLSLNSVS
jgi:hypothetical protein